MRVISVSQLISNSVHQNWCSPSYLTSSSPSVELGRFITVFTGVCHWSLPEPDESNLPPTYNFLPLLIFQKFLYELFCACYLFVLSYLVQFNHPDGVDGAYEVLIFSSCNLSRPPVTSSPVGLNVYKHPQGVISLPCEVPSVRCCVVMCN